MDKPVISIIHPSRGRPGRSHDCIDRWIKRAGIPITDLEVILSLDDDDPEFNVYRILYTENKNVIVCSGPNRYAVGAVNRGAILATGRIMIVVSDDFECPAGWAELIIKAIGGKQDFVLKVNDGTQKYIVTLPILDRKYYDRFGYIYHPDYKHMFSDTHLTHVADCLGKILWRNDILFPHKHYSVVKQRPDLINRRADATWNDGKRIYLKHVRNKFGLGVNVLAIDKNGISHLKWLKHYLRIK